MVLDDVALRGYIAGMMSADPALIELERITTNRTNVVHRCRLRGRNHSATSYFVVKQYLQHVAKIPSVKMGRLRAHHEFEALDLFRMLLGEQSVPATLGFDPEMHMLLLEDVPADCIFEGEMHYELLSEDDFFEIGQRLYRVHRSTIGLETLLRDPSEFTDYNLMRFECARLIFPREVGCFLDSLEMIPKSVIWGDCCPKNILLSEDRMAFIDLEFAHYNYPVLDLGFFAAHALLYGIKHPNHFDAMVTGIQDVFMGYRNPVDTMFCGVIDLAPAYAGIIMLHKTLSVARYMGYRDLEDCVVPMAEKLLNGAPVDYDLF